MLKNKKRINLDTIKTVFKFLFKFGFFTFVILLISILLSFYIYYLKVKVEFKNSKPRINATQTTLLDKNNEVIYESYGTKAPQFVSLQELPDSVKESTLAAEDVNFYKHDAYDLKGILRAVYENYKKNDINGAGKIIFFFDVSNYTQGGSTITQQLVKNKYLTNEKSFSRKIKEIVFANELEKKYSKDQILEMYLNEIYYGEQALGIQNASKIYFGKDAKDLKLSEASMLAGLPQAPTRYSPVSGDYLESKKRQEYVLQQMYLANYIDIETAKETVNEYLPLSGKKEFVKKYPYYVDWIISELNEKYGKGFVENGGFTVKTTLDPKIQEVAEKSVLKNLENFKYRKVGNAAVVVLDPETNEVRALVGGKNYDDSKVNVATSYRQPGSSFKPIVYATGIENGFTASSKFIDKYVNFGGNPPYAPRNYDGGYHGYVTMRKALAWSLNIPAVEMLSLVGLDKVIENGKNMGIDLGDDAKKCGLSLALGCKEVRLLDMVGAYSVFENNGNFTKPIGIISIKDNKDDIIYEKKSDKKRVLSEETAYIITNILSDVETRRTAFGYKNKLELGRPAAAKTGTTDNYTDSWTIGFTPDYVTGVWMGNNDRKPMLQTSGIEGAAYIWNDIMTEIHKDLPIQNFEKPEGVVEVKINSSTGQVIQTGSWGKTEVFKKGTEPKGKEDLNYLNKFK